MPQRRASHRTVEIINRTDTDTEEPLGMAEDFKDILKMGGGALAVVRAAIPLRESGTLNRSNYRELVRGVAEQVRATHVPNGWPAQEQPAIEPCVYFVRCGTHVKIGTTTRGAHARFSGMQLPPSAELVGVIPGVGVAEEYRLHQMFAAHHVRGEWFDSCPELEALITANPVPARRA